MQRPGESAQPSPPVRVPAEWEPPSCIWLSWPHNQDTWPGHFDPIPGFFARWARLIAETTPVRILAADETMAQCRSLLDLSADSAAENIRLVEIPTDDCWIRDYGPTFVVNQESNTLHGVNWRYNAWGGKYPPWDKDDAVAALLCRDAGIKWVDGPLCLEGGAMELDGQGRMLTNDCLINESRNPGSTRQQVAQYLYRYLGVTEIVWVDGGGLLGDDTDGHIDQLARFIDPRNVVVAVCDDPSDPNHQPLEQNYRQLRLWGTATQPSVEIHRLPVPPAREIGGQRVPESYCNFLRLGPHRTLVPTFGAATDDVAVAMLRELTGSEVIGIDCRDLVWGLGALHCASRDQPKTAGLS